jgi:hypothetical protein
MGLEIIIPVVLLVIVVPVAFAWAKKNLKDATTGSSSAEAVRAPSARLTSNALRDLPTPPWRIVHEIAEERLGGVEHVLIGPAGVFAVQTSMDPLPDAPNEPATPNDIARSAIVRGALDDALRRCALESDELLVVHWGTPSDAPVSVDTVPGAVAVNGRAVPAWAGARAEQRLTASQIDLAWQTVTTAIGRPDPLG